jgi:hypothetical protein
MKRILAILVSISLFSTPLSAQVDDPDATGISVPLFPELSGVDMDGDDDPMETENNGPAPGPLPVDGGLSLLLAAGAAYGARRLKRRIAV